MALKYADCGYILEIDRIMTDDPAKALSENADVKEFYLGLSKAGRKSFRDMESYRRRKCWSKSGVGRQKPVARPNITNSRLRSFFATVICELIAPRWRWHPLAEENVLASEQPPCPGFTHHRHRVAVAHRRAPS